MKPEAGCTHHRCRRRTWNFRYLRDWSLPLAVGTSAGPLLRTPICGQRRDGWVPHAELRGKISQSGSNAFDRMEDLLTSDVFGRLRYVPPDRNRR